MWAGVSDYTYDWSTDGNPWGARAVNPQEIKLQANIAISQGAKGIWYYPYYWAAFTLSGNSNPIQFVNGSNTYIYLFGLITLMLLGYLYIKKKYLVRHNDFRSRI